MTQRNGYRPRPWDTRAGEIELQVPKLCQGSYFPSFLQGLRQTASDPQGPISGPHVRGYLIGADGTMTDATNWHWGAGAAAGIVSNAPETAAFLVALMRGKLLERQWLETMRQDIWHGGSNSGCAGNAYGWGGAIQRRGRSAVRSEWRLITATHNLLKLHKHQIAAAGA